MSKKEISKYDCYSACRDVLGDKAWLVLQTELRAALAARSLSKVLRENRGVYPDFLPDLAELEEAFSSVSEKGSLIPGIVEDTCVNPTVQVLELPWKNLATLLPGRTGQPEQVEQARERVLLWLNPGAGTATAKPASDEDLLVLKIVLEGLDSESVARQGGVPVGAVDQALHRAAAKGLILVPQPGIRRHPGHSPGARGIPDRFLSSPSFTLQWHVTQACDLHCKHCYDRSSRPPLPLDRALSILDDLRSFCRSRHVAGAVSFTGGNPLLHPDFTRIYRAAAERGFSTAILGNPGPREAIEELIDIKMPAFFQLSLEGLREHNDSIRGPGHFDRVLAFLDLLRGLGVSSMIMLTLTSRNIEEVLPLAEALRGRADVFHFNRLSLAGEGANLSLPDAASYSSFLRSYLKAAETNPLLGIKENLINILRREQGMEPFGGCTGYGCGAAFNFVTLLADGEVHACRKFPSLIGNIGEQSLAGIYDSERLQQYRAGSAECRNCEIRPVCGGCLASSYSHGLNIFEKRDPFCFSANFPEGA